MSGWCNRCKSYHGDRPHLPIFNVWPEGGGSEERHAVEIGADEAEEAAARWGELDDQDGDYSIISGHEAEVNVRDPDGVLTRWKVTAESEPVYAASEVEP